MPKEIKSPTSDTTIQLQLPEEAFALLPVLRPRLQQALDHGVHESTFFDWVQRIVSGQAHVWVFREHGRITGAGLTQFLTYTRHKTLHIVLFQADSFDLCYPLLVEVERFARDNGCIAMEQWGRAGWSRELPKVVAGFREVYRVMRKDLV